MDLIFSSEAKTMPIKLALEDRVAQIKDSMGTQDIRPLIRQVAWVIFFEYGDIPTGNGIYKLLKKGSMTTYGIEVKAFWETLREQVKEVQSVTGISAPKARKIARELNEMWQQAMTLAHKEKPLGILPDESLEALTSLSKLRARIKTPDKACVGIDPSGSDSAQHQLHAQFKVSSKAESAIKS